MQHNVHSVTSNLSNLADAYVISTFHHLKRSGLAETIPVRYPDPISARIYESGNKLFTLPIITSSLVEPPL